MKKSILFTLLALLPLLASAYDAEVDGIYYNLITKGAIASVTTSPSKYKGDIVIPSQFEYAGVTYTVKEIESRAFNECFSLNSVTIPNSVETIGSYAFNYCRNLTTISFGTGLKTIGNRAFCVCQNLSSVYISDLAGWCNVTFEFEVRNQNDSSPFFYASHLFLNGKEVKDLVIPDGVTSISDHAFHKCSFTSITFPKSLTLIGNNGFASEELSSIKVAEGNSVFDSREGCDALIETATNTLILGCKNTSIPNSVTTIGSSAFSGCSGLTSVTIPYSVTTIGSSAFSRCSGLTSVTISNSVTRIGEYAFYGCSGLTSVTIPNNVTSIEESAFTGCSGLKEVTIGSGVKSIGKIAFANCTELTDVHCLAENVPSTNSTAFDGSYIEYVSLYVPEASVDAYKATAPWSGFGKIVALEGGEPEPVSKDISINATNFPDENFRNWILSQEYGSDGKLSEAEIAGITSMDVHGLNIKGLQGIEFFTALTRLSCFENMLTSLDVSKNTALQTLSCTYNQLTSLDVSKNTKLISLSCGSNQLVSLDVSQNTGLIYLTCFENQLASLDVSENTRLTSLTCFGNQLTSLDVSSNVVLQTLQCSENQLTSLDVSHNTALTWLDCFCNQLTSLDVSKNTNLTTIMYHKNQIKGVSMDDFVESLPSVSNGMMRVIYNENEGNVMTTIQVAAAKAKGWTPYYYDGSSWQEYAGSESNLRGDVNGDGKVSMADAMFIVNYLLNGKYPDEE